MMDADTAAEIAATRKIDEMREREEEAADWQQVGSEPNIRHECAECRQVVALGDAYFYNFTTGEYRHRACGLDTGRTLEELVSPAPRAQQTPPSMYEEIERLRVVNTDLLEALRRLVLCTERMSGGAVVVPVDASQATRMARAAIAAATGG